LPPLLALRVARAASTILPHHKFIPLKSQQIICENI